MRFYYYEYSLISADKWSNKFTMMMVFIILLIIVAGFIYVFYLKADTTITIQEDIKTIKG